MKTTLTYTLLGGTVVTLLGAAGSDSLLGYVNDRIV